MKGANQFLLDRLQKTRKKESNMTTQKMLKASMGLWLIALLLGFFAVFGRFDQTKLTTVKRQNTQLRHQIKQVKGEVNTSSPLAANYDLVKREAKISEQTQTSLAKLYGGLHSEADVKAARNELNQVLGKGLVGTSLAEIQGAVADNNQGNNATEQFIIEANQGVMVGFQPVINRHQAKALAVITYRLAGNRIQNKVYRLNFDLDTSKLVSYQALN